jgi:hypothetical protein
MGTRYRASGEEHDTREVRNFEDLAVILLFRPDEVKCCEAFDESRVVPREHNPFRPDDV